MVTEKQFNDRFVDIVLKHIKEQKISNEALAFKAGVATETVSRLRNKHKKRITAYLLFKIAKALGISLRDVERIL
jgi:transcriptional regulator with XRE-family HTH domain